MRPERITKTDKSGTSFEMGIGCAEDFPSVLEMYRNFSPKPASMGLPPEDLEVCQNWVQALINIGVNVLAWRGDRVIGHVAVIPDVERKWGEVVTFVDQTCRNLGIGTEVTRFALQKFGEQGFELVWLAVRVSNFAAVKLYKKLGFEFCDTDAYERVMVIELRPSGSHLSPVEPL